MYISMGMHSPASPFFCPHSHHPKCMALTNPTAMPSPSPSAMPSPSQVQSNPAVRPPDVLLTLSGDGASCVVTAGLEIKCITICILRRYCGTRNQLQSHPYVINIRMAFSQARSAVFLRHAVEDFLSRLVGTECGQDCRHGCGKLVFRQPCRQAWP